MTHCDCGIVSVSVTNFFGGGIVSNWDGGSMGRSRSRSRSYSPAMFRRNRSRSPFRRARREEGGGARRKGGAWRGRDIGGRYSSAPTSLLVRNIARDSRPEDVRIPFERFGTVKDVYLPKDYYSGYVRLLLKPAGSQDLVCVWGKSNLYSVLPVFSPR